MKDHFILAIRNLRKRGIRSWLTMLGIFIGIAAVVSLISLGDGLRTAVTAQFGVLDVDTLTIQNKGTGFGPPGSTVVTKLTEDDLQLIENTPGVEIATPRLVRIGKVKYNDIVQFKYLANLPTERDELNEIYNSGEINLLTGSLLGPNDKGKVLLGYDFLEQEEYDKKIRIGSILEIQGEDFRVAGFLEKTSSFTINSVILMNEDDLREILAIGDEIDLILAKVSDPNIVEDTAERLEKKLRQDRGLDKGEEDFSVETPGESLDTINSILGLINIIVTGIATISLLVGGIGIANTMYTSVLERTKEIGIMKAIGARNSDVLTLFLIEAGLLGLVGGIVGALIGLGFAYLVAFVATSAVSALDFSITFSFPLVFGSIGFAILIGSLSGIFPALQASKLKPVQALRS